MGALVLASILAVSRLVHLGFSNIAAGSSVVSGASLKD